MATKTKKTEEATEETVSPERDIKPVMDRIDALMEGAAPEGEVVEEVAVEEEMPLPEEEMPAEEAMAEDAMVDEEMAEGAVDLTPLMDTLGATEERAHALYDAAQQIAKTQGKTPQELADMIAEDFDVLMQLEMIAARSGDLEAEPASPMALPEAAMAPPAEAPMPVPAELEGA